MFIEEWIAQFKRLKLISLERLYTFHHLCQQALIKKNFTKELILTLYLLLNLIKLQIVLFKFQKINQNTRKLKFYLNAIQNFVLKKFLKM